MQYYSHFYCQTITPSLVSVKLYKEQHYIYNYQAKIAIAFAYKITQQKVAS